jgi:nucleoside-diphosphate-sugar epimerase
VDQMVRTNITGTINLVTACLRAGTEALVSAGSSSEYGVKRLPPSEEDLLVPNSHYAWTKAAATHFCRYMATQSEVHLPVLRLYSVYGPYEEPGRLIPTMVARGLRGHLPPLVSPEIARDFVYVDDVVSAFILAAQIRTDERGPVYNVGTGTETTLREVVDIALRCMSISDLPLWGAMAARQWDSTTWVSDSSKICRELGWRPGFTFEEGFARVVDWLRSNPELHKRYDPTAGVELDPGSVSVSSMTTKLDGTE